MKLRKSNRLKNHDYSQDGYYYFLTVCTECRMGRFGEIVNGQMQLNDPGQMVLNVWCELPDHFPNIELDECIVMPNHFHGILFAAGAPRATIKVAPTTLGKVMGAFKSITTKKYIDGVKRDGWPRFVGRLWQRNYHDNIIRTNESLEKIRDYIINNPGQWDCDSENIGNKRLILSKA